MHPVLLFIILLGVLVFASWYKRAPKSKQKAMMTKGLVFGGLALILLLLVTGRLNPLMAAVAALVPIGYRILSALQLAKSVKATLDQMKSADGPSTGQQSELETPYLRMRLDHDTGAMTGEVLAGRFAGQELSSLTFDQLLMLLAECRGNDRQSGPVLEAYLEREHAPAWQQSGECAEDDGNQLAASSSTMSTEEAYAILGIKPGAEKKEIVDAHRRLMQKMHPDRGGSTYLAAKLNQAKDLLLNA